VRSKTVAWEGACDAVDGIDKAWGEAHAKYLAEHGKANALRQHVLNSNWDALESIFKTRFAPADSACDFLEAEKDEVVARFEAAKLRRDGGDAAAHKVADAKVVEAAARLTPLIAARDKKARDEEAAPVLDEEAAPVPGKEAAPALDEEAAPAPVKEAAPVLDEEAAPAPDEEAAPGRGEGEGEGIDVEKDPEVLAAFAVNKAAYEWRLLAEAAVESTKAAHKETLAAIRKNSMVPMSDRDHGAMNRAREAQTLELEPLNTTSDNAVLDHLFANTVLETARSVAHAAKVRAEKGDSVELKAAEREAADATNRLALKTKENDARIAKREAAATAKAAADDEAAFVKRRKGNARTAAAALKRIRDEADNTARWKECDHELFMKSSHMRAVHGQYRNDPLTYELARNGARGWTGKSTGWVSVRFFRTKVGKKYRLALDAAPRTSIEIPAGAARDPEDDDSTSTLAGRLVPWQQGGMAICDVASLGIAADLAGGTEFMEALKLRVKAGGILLEEAKELGRGKPYCLKFQKESSWWPGAADDPRREGLMTALINNPELSAGGPIVASLVDKASGKNIHDIVIDKMQILDTNRKTAIQLNQDNLNTCVFGTCTKILRALKVTTRPSKKARL
jgi:hypothetical protein